MKKILFIFSALLLCSCGGEKKEPVPAHVLAHDQMVKLLKDMHIAEGESGIRTMENINDPAGDTVNYQEIFKKNGIQKWQYDSSMMYYSTRPELLNEIYDQVISELEDGKKSVGK
ncbi:MAG: DUF4296 domain-containing protein [Bacteroidota bacterium]